MGNLSLLQVEESDIPEIVKGQRLAFSDPIEPFWFILFPEKEREENFDAQVKRTLAWWKGDPSARFMKVVDEETGQIISAAKWCIYETPLTAEQMAEELVVDWHSDTDTNEWAAHVIHGVHSHRLQRTKGGRVAVLDMMSTHPSHHRRGAGKMLVQWGCDIADKMGVEAFIEGTLVAQNLYQSCGFRPVPNEYIYVDVPEKWKGRPQVKYFFMERQPRAIVGRGETVEEVKNVVNVEIKEAVAEEVS